MCLFLKIDWGLMSIRNLSATVLFIIFLGY